MNTTWREQIKVKVKFIDFIQIQFKPDPPEPKVLNNGTIGGCHIGPAWYALPEANRCALQNMFIF